MQTKYHAQTHKLVSVQLHPTLDHCIDPVSAPWGEEGGVGEEEGARGGRGEGFFVGASEVIRTENTPAEDGYVSVRLRCERSAYPTLTLGRLDTKNVTFLLSTVNQCSVAKKVLRPK